MKTIEVSYRTANGYQGNHGFNLDLVPTPDMVISELATLGVRGVEHMLLEVDDKPFGQWNREDCYGLFWVIERLEQ